MSGMLPAMSTATNPTGSDPAAATRPALSCATPAVSSGHAGGMAASQSLSTTPGSAAGANGRICQRIPAILAPGSPASRTHDYRSRSHLGHRADRIKQRPLVRINARLITSAADSGSTGVRASFEPRHGEARRTGRSFVRKTVTGRQAVTEPAPRTSRRYGQTATPTSILQSGG